VAHIRDAAGAVVRVQKWNRASPEFVFEFMSFGPHQNCEKKKDVGELDEL
jgi:hypothetical protein